MCPERRARGSVHDLIPCDITACGGVVGEIAGQPVESALVTQRGGVDADVHRSGRSRLEAIHGREIDARDLGNVVVIHKLGQVAVLHAVDDAHVLVLVRVVLAGFGEADTCVEAGCEKGELVAGPQVAVEAVDHGDRGHSRGRAFGVLDDVAAEFAGGRVVFAADLEEVDGGISSGRGGEALAEDTEGIGVGVAEMVGGGADDVVVQHARNVDGGVGVGLCEEVGPIEVLFLSRDGDEDHGGAGFAGGHDSSQFHHDCYAGPVVVCARGVAGIVVRVGAA